jgi:hypothetical protein
MVPWRTVASVVAKTIDLDTGANVWVEMDRIPCSFYIYLTFAIHIVFAILTLI